MVMFTRGKRKALDYGIKRIGKAVAGIVGSQLVKTATNAGVTKVSNAFKAKVSAKSKKRKRLPKKGKRSKTAFRKKVKAIIHNETEKQQNVSTYRKNALLDQKLEYNAPNIDYYVVGARFGNGNSAPFTPKACKFTPLSVERIADAAAVLYNGKLATYDATIETGNFDVVSTKINVVYAHYKLKMRNVTNIPIDVEVIEVTNKVNSDADEFFAFASSIKTYNSLFANTSDGFVRIETASPTTDNIWAVSRNLKFGDIKELGQHYSFKKLGTTRRILPAQEWSHTWKIKNKVFDLRKANQNSSFLADYAKGDKQILLKITPAMHVVYSTSVAQPGIATYKTVNEDYALLAFEVDEVFKIVQPENCDDPYEGERTVILNEQRIEYASGGNGVLRDIAWNGIAAGEGLYPIRT